MSGVRYPKSQITGGAVKPLFQAKVLSKYDVQYYQCQQTGYIQTESPYWLDEAYSSAITELDLGLVWRNLNKAELTPLIIDRSFSEAKQFIDYGGGYGMFTRLMRDRGYQFLHYDTHCQNLFAKNFQVASLASMPHGRFDLLTAWEVFEHLVSPRESINEMLSAANAILFSTDLVPHKPIREAGDWWYFTPETGQHISFYTAESFAFLAKELSLYFYSDGTSNHILSKTPLDANPFVPKSSDTIREQILRHLLPQRLIDSLLKSSLLATDMKRYLKRFDTKTVIRESLLQSDFQDALKLLRCTNSDDEAYAKTP